MALPTIAIVVVVIACILYLWMFVFAIITFFCWHKNNGKNETDAEGYLEPVSPKLKDNDYLNAKIAVDAKDSPHAYANDRVYVNEDMSFNVTDVLEDTVKKSVNAFCIETNRLQLGEIIGKGQFGVVYKATLVDKSLKNPAEVAVKTVYGDNCTKSDIECFLEEVMLMKGFQHRNVMTMSGLVLRDNRPFVILPFMENGDLRTFVSDHKKTFTIRELLDFGMQISDGMDYLSKHGFVHRDLAARNCMVADDLTVKVADFGLSRDLFNQDYYRMEDLSKPLPIRWMAVECLTAQVFTHKSDVWSFGIVMWELMTRGKTPYAGMESPALLKYVQGGERLIKPPRTPDEIYTIMTSCWKTSPTNRPTFAKISTECHSLLGDSSRGKGRKSISGRLKKTFRMKNR